MKYLGMRESMWPVGRKVRVVDLPSRDACAAMRLSVAPPLFPMCYQSPDHPRQSFVVLRTVRHPAGVCISGPGRGTSFLGLDAWSGRPHVHDTSTANGGTFTRGVAHLLKRY